MEFQDNPNYRTDIDNAFQKGDIKEFINSLKDEDYRNYIQKKYELIVDSFEKLDKNKDSVIDYDELISFLDGNMTVMNTDKISLARNLIKTLLRR
jgi:Ca2+-binding EF-hand superfamily protein